MQRSLLFVEAKQVAREQLEAARTRFKKALHGEYADEMRRRDEEAAAAAQKLIDEDPREQEMARYRDMYGSVEAAYARFKNHEDPVDPAYYERKAARRRRPEDREALPDPFADYPSDESGDDLILEAWEKARAKREGRPYEGFT